MNDATLELDNPIRFKKKNHCQLIKKMTVCEKIKAINNKIKQNKAQYDLDAQIANISTLPSGNLSKCESLSGEDILPETGFLEKVATIKRFTYSSLVIKRQTEVM